MFIRYNEALDFWEYDTSASQTGAGPWVLLPIDASKLIVGPALGNIAYTNVKNIFTYPQIIEAGTVDIPYIGFRYTAQGPDLKNSRFEGVGDFYISHTNDADNVYLKRWRFARNGDTECPANISGHGVYLGLNVASSYANVLDDYEEGTWTPTLTSTTGGGGTVYSTQQGRYTKIGNVVTAMFDITLQSANWTSGGCLVSNFPFVNGGELYTVGHLEYYSISGAVYVMQLHMQPGAAHCYLPYKNSISATAHDGYISIGNVGVGHVFRGTIIYRTAT